MAQRHWRKFRALSPGVRFPCTEVASPGVGTPSRALLRCGVLLCSPAVAVSGFIMSLHSWCRVHRSVVLALPGLPQSITHNSHVLVHCGPGIGWDLGLEHVHHNATVDPIATVCDSRLRPAVFLPVVLRVDVMLCVPPVSTDLETELEGIRDELLFVRGRAFVVTLLFASCGAVVRVVLPHCWVGYSAHGAWMPWYTVVLVPLLRVWHRCVPSTLADGVPALQIDVYFMVRTLLGRPSMGNTQRPWCVLTPYSGTCPRPHLQAACRLAIDWAGVGSAVRPAPRSGRWLGAWSSLFSFISHCCCCWCTTWLSTCSWFAAAYVPCKGGARGSGLLTPAAWPAVVATGRAPVAKHGEENSHAAAAVLGGVLCVLHLGFGQPHLADDQHQHAPATGANGGNGGLLQSTAGVLERHCVWLECAGRLCPCQLVLGVGVVS